MKALISTLTEATKKAKNTFLRLSRMAQSAVVLVVIIVIAIALHSKADKDITDESAQTKRAVSVATVGELSSNSTPIPLLGTVTSRSEATIRAESSGKINAVYKKLGDYVSAGAVIAEFENSAERAQVLQAEGAYDASKAGRDIAGINRGSAGNSLAEAKTQALNAMASTYTGLDDAVRTKTDVAWRNPQTREAKLIVGVSDAKLVIEIEEERIAIEAMLRAREERNRTLTTDSDLVAELGMVESEANTVKDYLDDLSLAFNRSLPDGSASQSAIDGYKANTAGARAAVNGILSSLTGTRNALNAALSGAAIAEKNGSANSGDSAADAQLKSALGNLRAAQARLEKTIVRSPISGTINSLSVDTGDFVSPFTEIAVVSNNGALELLAYATEDEQRELSLNAPVMIEGGIAGVITRIAPALDPKTKKIEVRIGISGSVKTLVNGQSVSVAITRNKSSTIIGASLSIPLAAIKLTPNGALVFTVSDKGTLVAHPVKEGALQGDRITIREGLTSDMQIVTDARGLKEGMEVNLK